MLEKAQNDSYSWVFPVKSQPVYYVFDRLYGSEGRIERAYFDLNTWLQKNLMKVIVHIKPFNKNRRSVSQIMSCRKSDLFDSFIKYMIFTRRSLSSEQNARFRRNVWWIAAIIRSFYSQVFRSKYTRSIWLHCLTTGQKLNGCDVDRKDLWKRVILV